MTDTLLCSTCGWSRRLTGPRPLTELGRAMERSLLSAGHVMAMVLSGESRHHRVTLAPPPIEVILELDASGFLAAMDSASRAGHRMLADFERRRWDNAVRRERIAARRWWGEHITAAYARYGWDWPGPPPGSPWGPRS